MDVLQVLTLGIPVVIAVITEAMKRIPQVPVTSKNAKWCVFVLALVIVVGTAWHNGTLTQDMAVSLSLDVVVFYGLTIGFYETVKNLVKKYL